VSARSELAGTATARAAAGDTDPDRLAGAAVAELLASSGVDAGAVPLLVIGIAHPDGAAGPISSPLLGGELASHVVGRVLADNGLTSAVPFGITVDEGQLARAAGECAVAMMTAEALTSAVVVTVSVPPVSAGPAAHLVANAFLLHRAEPEPTATD
jgi:hypothetical protein